MLPQFDRDVFDTSPDKIAKVDNLHIPDLPMLHFPQNLTQNKKYSYHVTYHVTPKSFEQFLFGFLEIMKKLNRQRQKKSAKKLAAAEKSLGQMQKVCKNFLRLFSFRSRLAPLYYRLPSQIISYCY